MTNSGPCPVGEVSVTIDDVTYRGTYWVENQTVYVKSPLGEKAAQVGDPTPGSIAKLLLSMARGK